MSYFFFFVYIEPVCHKIKESGPKDNPYHYLQIAESCRDGKSVRQRVIATGLNSRPRASGEDWRLCNVFSCVENPLTSIWYFKMLYLAQCITGLQEVISSRLMDDGICSKIEMHEEGLVLFNSQKPTHIIARISYLNNTFSVIHELRTKYSDGDLIFKDLIIDRCFKRRLEEIVINKKRTFKVFFINEGQLLKMAADFRNELVRNISQRTGLKYSPGTADIEFWLIRRRSRRTFFCMRLSKRRWTEKNLQKGELRPELAETLCYLSEPSKSDVFLDPFAGSGAIPFARTKWKYNLIFAFDKEEGNIRKIKRESKAKKKITYRKNAPFIARKVNAKRLESIDDSFIDKIVTDPPWGHYAPVNSDILSAYRQFFSEMCRVVKKSGIIIVLIGSDAYAETLVEEFDNALLLENCYNILVSGHKAVVMKWRKK